MSENTDPAPAATMLHDCVVCDIRLIGGVAVGLIERGSGPGHTLFACSGCVRRKNILPLDEQEQHHGDGRLQFRTGSAPEPEPAATPGQ